MVTGIVAVCWNILLTCVRVFFPYWEECLNRPPELILTRRQGDSRNATNSLAMRVSLSLSQLSLTESWFQGTLPNSSLKKSNQVFCSSVCLWQQAVHIHAYFCSSWTLKPLAIVSLSSTVSLWNVAVPADACRHCLIGRFCLVSCSPHSLHWIVGNSWCWCCKRGGTHRHLESWNGTAEGSVNI